MYLSRLLLNERSYSVRRDLGDCYSMHRTVMSAFPDVAGAEADARSRLGVLYRLETDRSAGNPRLYVQSLVEPDWTGLPAEYLSPGPENPATRSLDEAYARLKVGTRLAFTLTANPAKKVGTTTKAERLAGKKDNGRRTPIVGVENQIAWLKAKAESAGFEVVEGGEGPNLPEVIVTREASVRGRGSGGQEESIALNAVVFQGMLRVTDAERFQGALRSGIGAGKAYGMGLLTIALLAPSA
jgi:CRISPR system Cascade subunit CasE